MSILSSEPIVFIGPGSEWFWSMAQLVVVAVTLVGIYHQLRLQRAANAFEQLKRLDADYDSETLVRAKLRIGRALRAGTEPPPGAMVLLVTYWVTVADLVRRGHVDARDLRENLGPAVGMWWALLEDHTRRKREEGVEVLDLVQIEWLAGVFEGFAARDSIRTMSDDRASIVGGLDQYIEGWEEIIEMAVESRTDPKPVKPARRRSAHTAAAADPPVAS